MVDNQFFQNIVIACQREEPVKQWALSLKQFWTIKTVNNADDLQHELSSFAGSIVLLDISLPGLEHKKALAEFYGRYPESKIIILTDADEPDEIIEYLQSGAKGYCSYDISTGLLKKAIETVAEGDNWVERRIVNSILTTIVNQHGQNFQKPLSKSANQDSDLTPQHSCSPFPGRLTRIMKKLMVSFSGKDKA